MKLTLKSTLFATAAAACALTFTPTDSRAATVSPIDLGTARDYAFITTGDKVKINSGPIDGDALLGNDVDVDFSGGNNGGINGTLFYDQSIVDNGGTSEFADLDNPGTDSQVADSVVDQAVTDAEAAAAAASALAPTTAFTGQDITGNGGVNVFNSTDLNNPEFTITGTMDDFFVFNVSGKLQTNQAMTLVGVDASQILWNFTGTGTVLQTSGGNALFGTFLSTGTGAKMQGSNLDITGALINTAGEMQFVSGSSLPQFVPLAEVESNAVIPLPAAGWLLLTGFGAIALAGRRRRAAA